MREPCYQMQEDKTKGQEPKKQDIISLLDRVIWLNEDMRGQAHCRLSVGHQLL